MDKCHFRKIHIFFGRKINNICFKGLFFFFFLHTQVGHRLPVTACIHLEDLIEIPDIIPIRCQNLPDHMIEGSEGEARKKCISLTDQLN